MIASLVPAEDWASGLGDVAGAEGQSYYPIEDNDAVWDGFVEVFDRTTGASIAWRRFPNLSYIVPISGDLFGALRETDLGWWKVDVYRFVVHDVAAGVS